MNRDDIYYEALKTRDYRFDGKFFVGVKTTGIYCRPICPARPKRENVEFFGSGLAAERAGYRPCLRCRPESAPRSPAWVGKSAIVQRALKILLHEDCSAFDEDSFASRFGVSARHLRRVFVEEIGKTPKQIAVENRLNFARKLIVETALPLTEVAFASGFRSVRRFNDAFKQRFKRNPSECRRNRAEKNAPLRLTLPYRPPFDFEGLLYFYRAHQTGRLEWFSPGHWHRVLAKDGQVGTLVVSDDPSHSRILLEIDFPDTTALHWIIGRVRTQFDLDSDPLLIANSLEVDPKLRRLVRKYPGLRLPSGWDSFEVAVSTILGQLVTVKFGRALVSDLIENLGEISSLEIQGHRIRLFPTAESIAKSDLAFLKTTRARKQALIAFSKAVLEKRISLEPTQDVDRFTQSLLSIRGIGPWTANYMALKVIRHADAFPETDLILARALEQYSKEIIDRTSPWRGYVAALLWREYSAKTEKAYKRRKT